MARRAGSIRGIEMKVTWSISNTIKYAAIGNVAAKQISLINEMKRFKRIAITVEDESRQFKITFTPYFSHMEDIVRLITLEEEK